jgi:hypothetical protein
MSNSSASCALVQKVLMISRAAEAEHETADGVR